MLEAGRGVHPVLAWHARGVCGAQGDRSGFSGSPRGREGPVNAGGESSDQTAVRKHGAADRLFRGEEVYLCWKLDEASIQFWHGTHEGFAGRKGIDQDFLDHHEGEKIL